MTNTDHEKTVGSLPPERREMPLPGDPNTIYLAGLFVFGTLGAAYLASDIVLPLVIAFFLKLLVQPLVRTLENLYATRALASLLVIILLFTTIVGLTAAISGPASTWAAKLPQGISRLENRLAFLRAPIDVLQRLLEGADRHTEGRSSSVAPNIERGSPLMMNLITKVFAEAQSFASGFF